LDIASVRMDSRLHAILLRVDSHMNLVSLENG